MAKIFYAVTATLPGRDLASEYVGWLEGGHVGDVIAAGATSAAIVRLDPPADDPDTVRIETQYVFPSRGVFDGYEREHAPALREIGRDRFGGRGVSFERRVGEIAFGGR